MSDEHKKPETGTPKRQRQTGEEHGSVKSPQLEQQAERADLARGSETETRRAGSQRR